MNCRYHEFHLAIEPAGAAAAGYAVTLRRDSAPPESQQDHGASFRLSGPEASCLSSLRAAGAVPPSTEALQELGRALAALLLPPKVQSLLFAILARDIGSSVPIRLRLDIGPPELMSLPWELAYLDPPPFMPAASEYLGLHPRFHIVRQPVTAAGAELSPAFPVRVLVAWANPATPAYPALHNVEGEARTVLAALRQRHSIEIEVEELPDATPETLRTAVQRQRPHILHFIGHGEDGQGGSIVLQGQSEGEAAYVSGKALADWLAGIDVRLVALSACQTAGVAATLVRSGLGAVLAMQLPWCDLTSTPFFRTFYGALLESRGIGEALRESRQALSGAPPNWAVPALYQSRDTEILFAPPQAENGRHWHVPYPLNADFCGRNGELEEMHHSLTEAPKQRMALVGLGGIGKTQLASEYAHRYLREYPGGIYWINARDDRRVKEDYAQISIAFGISESLSIENRAQQMRQLLQKLTHPSLLIFDNMTQDTDTELLPTMGNCRVLATAREEYAVRGSFRLYRISPLADEAAWALLQTRRTARSDEEMAAVQAIATLLGNLPLALALVAERVGMPTLDENDRPFEKYLGLLRRDPKRWLDNARRHFTAFTKHDGALFDAIEISYRALSPTAQRILSIASCFAARSIPPRLLLSACATEDEEEFADALAELTGSSLMIREEQGRLSIHEVVRFFARSKMSDDAFRAVLGTVAGVLAANLEAGNLSMDWRGVRGNIVHCRAALNLCRTQPSVENYASLLRQLGIYCFEQRELAEAEEHLTTGLAIAEQRGGPARPEVAGFLRWLGCVRQTQGEYARARGEATLAEERFGEAIRLHERALQIALSTYGHEAVQLIDYYNDLGYTCSRQGARERAEQNFGRALEISLKVHGSRHLDVAMCLNNIGAELEYQNRLDEAIGKLRQSRSIIRRLYGVPETRFRYRVLQYGYAIRMNNIGRILRSQGKARTALIRHRAALTIFLELYAGLSDGQRHIAHTYYYIAEANRLLEMPGEARYYYRLALPMLVRQLGSNHAICGEVEAKLQMLSDEAPREP